MSSKIHPSLKPIAEPYDKKNYRLVEPFAFYFKGTHVIPAGYIWDGASIPRAFWFSTGTPFDPVHIGPSLIHDYMCDNPHITKSQAKADAIYRDNLGLNDVGWFWRNREYLAVRSFQCLKGNIK